MKNRYLTKYLSITLAASVMASTPMVGKADEFLFSDGAETGEGVSSPEPSEDQALPEDIHAAEDSVEETSEQQTISSTEEIITDTEPLEEITEQADTGETQTSGEPTEPAATSGASEEGSGQPETDDQQATVQDESGTGDMIISEEPSPEPSLTPSTGSDPGSVWYSEPEVTEAADTLDTLIIQETVSPVQDQTEGDSVIIADGGHDSATAVPTQGIVPSGTPVEEPVNTATATATVTPTVTPELTATPSPVPTGIIGITTSMISNLHAGKEFYLNSLKQVYGLTFSDKFSQQMEQIELDYLKSNGLVRPDGTVGLPYPETTPDPDMTQDPRLPSPTPAADLVPGLDPLDGRNMPKGLLARNWQDVLAIYVYEQSLNGQEEFILDESSSNELSRIFAQMNPVTVDEERQEAYYGNLHVNSYIRTNNIPRKDRAVLKKYLETDCKLLCATVTGARGFVRQSVGDQVSEERVDVITAAYSLVGKVGYFWGGKSTVLGEDPSWGTVATVGAEGSSTTGTLRAYGLDCSGFVTWAVINGYEDPGMQAVVGDGTSDQWEKAKVVAEADAQPGDLVFQRGPEAGSQNHVGILVGKTDSGDWIAVHCSSGQNGVTVGEAYSASFRYIREPSFFPEKEKVVEPVAVENIDDIVVEADLEGTDPGIGLDDDFMDIILLGDDELNDPDSFSDDFRTEPDEFTSSDILAVPELPLDTGVVVFDDIGGAPVTAGDETPVLSEDGLVTDADLPSEDGLQIEGELPSDDDIHIETEDEAPEVSEDGTDRQQPASAVMILFTDEEPVEQGPAGDPEIVVPDETGEEPEDAGMVVLDQTGEEQPEYIGMAVPDETGEEPGDTGMVVLDQTGEEPEDISMAVPDETGEESEDAGMVVLDQTGEEPEDISMAVPDETGEEPEDAGMVVLDQTGEESVDIAVAVPDGTGEAPVNSVIVELDVSADEPEDYLDEDSEEYDDMILEGDLEELSGSNGQQEPVMARILDIFGDDETEKPLISGLDSSDIEETVNSLDVSDPEQIDVTTPAPGESLATDRAVTKTDILVVDIFSGADMSASPVVVEPAVEFLDLSAGADDALTLKNDNGQEPLFAVDGQDAWILGNSYTDSAGSDVVVFDVFSSGSAVAAPDPSVFITRAVADITPEALMNAMAANVAVVDIFSGDPGEVVLYTSQDTAQDQSDHEIPDITFDQDLSFT